MGWEVIRVDWRGEADDRVRIVQCMQAWVGDGRMWI